MNRALILIAIIMISCLAGNCQSHLPAIVPGDIPDGTILRSDHYTGTSLWGYIDGGADIYLEYGFDRLSVQNILWNNDRLAVEIYRMTDPEAAFGIFSLTNRHCRTADSVGPYSCVSPFQVLAACGSYYISVSNEKGSPREEAETVTLAGILVRRIGDSSFVPPAFFRREIFTRTIGELQVMRGPLGIQNGMPEWDGLFDEVGRFIVYTVPFGTDSVRGTAALIRFDKQDGMERFYKNIRLAPDHIKRENTVIWKNGIRYIREESPRETVFIETREGSSLPVDFRKKNNH